MIRVFPDGRILAIYDDRIDWRKFIGRPKITRASHVEPVDTPTGSMWQADLRPVNGPVLGLFAKRQEALDAEVEWLIQNFILRTTDDPDTQAAQKPD